MGKLYIFNGIRPKDLDKKVENRRFSLSLKWEFFSKVTVKEKQCEKFQFSSRSLKLSILDPGSFISCVPCFLNMVPKFAK